MAFGIIKRMASKLVDTMSRQSLTSVIVGSSASGVRVDDASALGHTAIYRACANVGEALGMTPLILYERGGDDGEARYRARRHPLYRVLRENANPEMTAYSFWEAMGVQRVLRGNAYAEIVRNRRGDVVELWPLWAHRMTPERKPDGSLIYRYRVDDGNEYVLPASDVLHIPGMMTGGLVGRSPIYTCKDALSVGIALDRFVQRFLSEGMSLSGILKHPRKVSPEAMEQMRQSVNARHAGVDKAHRMMILHEGWEWTQTGVDPQAAQVIEQRTFSIGEVARATNMPSHKLHDMSNASYNNIEQMSLDYGVWTLDPHFTAVEQSVGLQLLRPAERSRYYVEFLRESILQVDFEKKINGYVNGIQWGWMTRNEVRRAQNMNPLEGLDRPLIPLNMLEIDETGNAVIEADVVSQEAITDEGDERTVYRLPAARGALKGVKVISKYGRRFSPADGAADDEAEALAAAERRTRSAEQRRSGQARRRLRGAYRKVIRANAQKVVTAEVSRLRPVIKDLRSRQIRAVFDERLTEVYAQFADYIRSTMGPVLDSFIEAIVGEALAEAGADGVGAAAGFDPDVFTENYIEGFINRWIYGGPHDAGSINQIQALEDAEAMEERLDEWEDKRADKTAQQESTRASSAAAAEVFRSLGLALRWQINDGACPLCQELAGQVVQGVGLFLAEGDVVDPNKDGVTPLTAGSGIGHPPLHGGCDCDVGL